jgi:microcompartment protein CcmK/EutM
MRVARVLAPVVSTVKHPSYRALKLLMCRDVDPDGALSGRAYIAVDRVQAGEGDLVLIMDEGNGVRQLFGADKLPIRTLIVGVVDEVDVPSSTG